MVRCWLLMAPAFAVMEQQGRLFRKISRKEPHNVAEALAGIGLDWDMERIGDRTMLNSTSNVTNITFSNGESALSDDWDLDNSSTHQPTAADIAAANAAAARAHQRQLRNGSATKTAVSSKDSAQLKNAPLQLESPAQPKIHAGHEVHGGSDVHPSGLATPGAMVLPVAAVVIIEPRNATGLHLHDQQPPTMHYMLSQACQENMNELTKNATKAEKASLCEKKANFTAKAVAALEAGNSRGAVHSVEAALIGCSHMEPQCARDIATQVVQKLRVSGFAMDKRCLAVSEQIDNAEYTESDYQCIVATKKRVINSLKMTDSSDMGFELAIRYAQEGLRNCQNVQAPCDFQIAPSTVKAIVQEHVLEEDRGLSSLAEFFVAGQDAVKRLAKGSLLQAAT